ncbi:hypothetical protein AVEN_264101-1 [Araneus ventricosus]|uniref:Uncharacterized protein n=1 Tax=Araneus ventricosus TaxID=182803 RepID=A0A4Y2KYG4_ARAVE|nr:hypothetical protein AVEN_264101-1 [Araneus ventricosus]
MVGEKYLTFLEIVLPTFLLDVLVDIRQGILFQHDGAPTLYANSVVINWPKTLVRNGLGEEVLSLGHQSHQINSPLITSFMGSEGAMKRLVYETSVDSDVDLIARVSVATGKVRGLFGIIQNVR